MATPQQQSTNSRLLHLPGELRNRIYRYAVVGSTKGAPIDVTISSIPEPALLRTRKQIRAEAISIFYIENHFKCITSGFDSRVHLLFERKLIAIHKNHHVNLSGLPEIALELRGPYNWPNLKLWARRLHSRELGMVGDVGASQSSPIAPIPGAGIRAAEGILVRSIFDLATDLRGIPWAVVEGILDTTHATLITLDARWA